MAFTLKRNGDGTLIKNIDGTLSTCCCCSNCTGLTPLKIQIVIAGSMICDCVDVATGSTMNFAGTVDGTYCLTTADTGASCCWNGTMSGLLTLYRCITGLDTACNPALADPSPSTTFSIQLCTDGMTGWILSINATNGSLSGKEVYHASGTMTSSGDCLGAFTLNADGNSVGPCVAVPPLTPCPVGTSTNPVTGGTVTGAPGGC